MCLILAVICTLVILNIFALLIAVIENVKFKKYMRQTIEQLDKMLELDKEAIRMLLERTK